MIQPPKEVKVRKERKYKKEAQIDPDREYQKTIEIKGDVFTFNMRGRHILNQDEFNRFVARMDTYIRPFTASNVWKIPGGEFDDLYNAFVYRLWRCIATYNNTETSRVEDRASFPTYFMSILRKDLENKRVTRDKSRTIERLKKKGKDLEAQLILGLTHATPMSALEPWQIEQLGAVEIEEKINEDDDEYELVEVTTTTTTTTTTYKVRKACDEAIVVGSSGCEDVVNINAEEEEEEEKEDEQIPE